MAGDDDWEHEYDENAETKADNREAVPEAIAAKDTTGKYKTLNGYGVVAGVQNEAAVLAELAFGRGCAHCTKKVLTALKLWMMSLKVDHDAAQARIDRFLVWMNDPQNAELIRVALAEPEKKR